MRLPRNFQTRLHSDWRSRMVRVASELGLPGRVVNMAISSTDHGIAVCLLPGNP